MTLKQSTTPPRTPHMKVPPPPLVERATFKTTTYSAKSRYSARPGIPQNQVIPQNFGIPQNQVIPQNRGILLDPVFLKIKLLLRIFCIPHVFRKVQLAISSFYCLHDGIIEFDQFVG